MSRTFKDSLEEDLDAFFDTNEFAVIVSITRGEDDPTTDVPALVSQVSHEASSRTQDRMSLKFERWDYRIKAADYIVTGVQTLPTEGDKIGRILRSGTVLTCQVVRTSDRPCYELDSTGLVLLVHTKRT